MTPRAGALAALGLGLTALLVALGFALFAAVLVIVGIQVFFASFLLSILGLRRRG